VSYLRVIPKDLSTALKSLRAILRYLRVAVNYLRVILKDLSEALKYLRVTLKSCTAGPEDLPEGAMSLGAARRALPEATFSLEAGVRSMEGSRPYFGMAWKLLISTSDYPEYESSCSILESTQSKSPRVILAPQWPHSPAMLT
jgi:hypothetical protein